MLVTAVGLPAGATSTTFIGSFELESGQTIRDVMIGYTAYGTINEVCDRRSARQDSRIFWTSP
jgi:homoserine acetyltransferase